MTAFKRINAMIEDTTPDNGDFLLLAKADGATSNKVDVRTARKAPVEATGAATLALTDVGKVKAATGTITVPDATFAAGDVVTIYNNTASDLTLTCSITTAYLAGENTDKASLTLATRGLATILFISGTVCVVAGNVT